MEWFDTTAIQSSTKESGNIVGKMIADIKSLLIDLELLTFSRGRQGASVMVAWTTEWRDTEMWSDSLNSMET